jgi:4-amino-4-deoxy-L-arabinose transferase
VKNQLSLNMPWMKKKWFLYLCLFTLAISVRLFVASKDPFLNRWDEQFHALVAKHLVIHPLKPTLFEHTLIPFNYKNWDQNEIWLHKQPLFLWQIALSIRLFGTNEIAVRIPSILLSALMVLLLFSIACKLSNRRTAIIAALLLIFLQFELALVSGALGMDHNDISFSFYLLASFWAWLKYRSNTTTYWAIIIGLFSGAAMLCKWLTGIWVIGIWGFYLIIRLIQKQNNEEIKKELGHLFLSLITSGIIFIPWQLYCYLHYPAEFKQEYWLNAHHFNYVVEGHEGPWYFHFKHLFTLYNWLYIPLIASILLIKNWFSKLSTETKNTWSALLGGIAAWYIFFTLAKTKIIPFTAPMIPFLLLLISIQINSTLKFLQQWIKNRMLHQFIVPTLIICLCCIVAWQHPLYKNLHYNNYDHFGWGKEYHEQQSNLKRHCLVWNKTLEPNAVIYNFQNEDQIMCMFYSNFTCYGALNQEQIDILKNKHTILYEYVGKGVLLQVNPMPKSCF